MANVDIPTHKLPVQLSDSEDFELQKMEATQPYNSDVAHRHNYFEIFYFVKGGGTHEIDFTRQEINSHSLHFLSPGQVHLVKRTPGSHGYVIKFSPDFLKLGQLNNMDLYDLPLFDHSPGNADVQVERDDIPEFDNLFEKMQLEYNSREDSKFAILRSYLQILLIKSCRVYKNQYSAAEYTEGWSSGLVKKFRKEIEANFKNKHRLEEYAQMLHVTSNHLSTTVKEQLGMPASDLIHERITLESKRLLYHSDKTVKEIAYSLGFSDPSYFSRYFKKRVGCSPNAFRENTQ